MDKHTVTVTVEEGDKMKERKREKFFVLGGGGGGRKKMHVDVKTSKPNYVPI